MTLPAAMYLRAYAAHLNRLGIQIVADYRSGISHHNKCYRDSYSRVRRAGRKIASRSLVRWDRKTEFCRLWGSLIGKDDAWKDFPEEYRGMGAPGALASEGWANIIEQREIWAGSLFPGAVMQSWRLLSDYKRVKKGRSPLRIGHSFIFIKYEMNDSGIVGMKVADNKFHGTGTVKKSAWGFLVGANIYSP